jgi:hypothetical protein
VSFQYHHNHRKGFILITDPNIRGSFVGLFATAVDCKSGGSLRAGLEGNVGDSVEDDDTDLGRM